MNIKRKLASIATAAAVAIGVSLAVPASASALSDGAMTQACRIQYGAAGWTAHYYYEDQGVGGWRCFYNNAPWAVWYNERKGLSVQGYCYSIYGNNAHYSNWNDRYSWYCA